MAYNLNDQNGDDGLGITKQVCTIANSTFKYATSALFGTTEKNNFETNLIDVIDHFDSLPIEDKANSKMNIIHDKQAAEDKTKVAATRAIQVPEKSTTTSSVSITSSSSTKVGITFGMGSSWKSSRKSSWRSLRSRSTCSESGYEGSFYGSSVKSNLSILEHKEENLEKQKLLDSLPLFTLEEVQKHCYEDDAWMVFYDRVYNVTDFLIQHPGGIEVMQEYLGLDATIAFQGVGHSQDAIEMLENYLIGILPKSERVYKVESWTAIW